MPGTEIQLMGALRCPALDKAGGVFFCCAQVLSVAMQAKVIAAPMSMDRLEVVNTRFSCCKDFSRDGDGLQVHTWCIIKVIWFWVVGVGCLLAQPPTCVLQHLNHFGLFKNGVGFMTWSEIEDFSFADIPSHAAAEAFALVPRFFEDNLIWIRHMKGFVVHFCLRHLERFWQISGNRMFG